MNIIYYIFYRLGFIQTQYFWTWLYFSYSTECSPTFTAVGQKRSRFWQSVFEKKKTRRWTISIVNRHVYYAYHFQHTRSVSDATWSSPVFL